MGPIWEHQGLLTLSTLGINPSGYRTMVIRRLSIIGVGLLGGSLGLAAKKLINGCHVIGYGHRAMTLGKAIEMSAIDQATQDLTEAVRDADCVVLCTPVGMFQRLLTQMSPS